MVIISYKRFMFKGVTGATFTTKGSGALEEAPDWIRETQLYGWALGDGDIIEAVDHSDKSAYAADDKAKKTKSSRAKKAPEPVDPAAEA